MDMKFLNYTPTSNEKHLGIATIKLYEKIVLRFKMISTKDGASFFCGCVSYKMPDPTGGDTDVYLEAFMIESRSEYEDVKNFIRCNVKKYMENNSAPPKKENSGGGEPVPF